MYPMGPDAPPSWRVKCVAKRDSPLVPYNLANTSNRLFALLFYHSAAAVKNFGWRDLNRLVLRCALVWSVINESIDLNCSSTLMLMSLAGENFN